MEELTQMRQKMISNLAQKSSAITDISDIKIECEKSKINIAKLHEELKLTVHVDELAITNARIRDCQDELDEYKDKIENIDTKYNSIKKTIDTDYNELFTNTIKKNEFELLKTELQNVNRGIVPRDQIIKSFKDIYECINAIENTGLTPRNPQCDEKIKAMECDIEFLKKEIETLKKQPKVTVIADTTLYNDDSQSLFEKPKKFIKH